MSGPNPIADRQALAAILSERGRLLYEEIGSRVADNLLANCPVGGVNCAAFGPMIVRDCWGFHGIPWSVAPDRDPARDRGGCGCRRYGLAAAVRSSARTGALCLPRHAVQPRGGGAGWPCLSVCRRAEPELGQGARGGRAP